MRAKGKLFATGEVKEWWDCGNKNATVYTNQRVLQTKANQFKINQSKYSNATTIVEPCYIGKNVDIKGSTVGPNVSIGDNSVILNSTIENSIIQNETTIKNINFKNSMVGNFVTLDGNAQEFSFGDYSTQE
jgi:glucose-1-phosphate thymidylyltransferase